MPRNPAASLSYRHAIAAVLALTLVVGSGAAFVYTASEPGTALTVSGLDVSDADRELGPSGSVGSATLDVTLSYEYQSSHQPTAVELELFVADGPDGQLALLDSQTLADPQAESSGQTTLSGDLLESDAFPPGTFEVAQGETAGTDVFVKAVMTLRRDGERIATADAETTAHASVTKEEITVSAQLAGDGGIQLSEGG